MLHERGDVIAHPDTLELSNGVAKLLQLKTKTVYALAKQAVRVIQGEG